MLWLSLGASGLAGAVEFLKPLRNGVVESDVAARDSDMV